MCPQYQLEGRKRQPSNDSFNYNPTLQLNLDRDCKRQVKWSEIPYVQVFMVPSPRHLQLQQNQGNQRGFRGLLHYHQGTEHHDTQADMVLEKKKWGRLLAVSRAYWRQDSCQEDTLDSVLVCLQKKKGGLWMFAFV